MNYNSEAVPSMLIMNFRKSQAYEPNETTLMQIPIFNTETIRCSTGIPGIILWLRNLSFQSHIMPSVYFLVYVWPAHGSRASLLTFILSPLAHCVNSLSNASLRLHGFVSYFNILRKTSTPRAKFAFTICLLFLISFICLNL